MSQSHFLKIDIFPHVIPPRYVDAVAKALGRDPRTQGGYQMPALWDLDLRFRILDKYEGLMQVLSLGMTAGIPEQVDDIQTSIDLARLANDELAGLVSKYPDRFAAAIACLPMNDMDAALKETDRVIKDLKFRGVQIFTPTHDKPLDSPEFLPLYQKMAEYNLPIWIHPSRGDDYADYRTENRSIYRIASTFGWPYETSTAITRLVFSGVLEKYPNLKFITHHAGGMVPFYAARIAQFQDTDEMLRHGKNKERLSKAPIEYFKMFYADTALNGNTPGLMCAFAFFGAEHLLFGTDMPYDNQLGDRDIRETIWAIEDMDISDSDKKKIFGDNARRLLRLPV
jgi:predicted TIM-barrel fold metal-dependent hydrolase